MNRRETTELLEQLLRKQKLSGKIWKSEVCLDYGTSDIRRVDFMEFRPCSKLSDMRAGNIEKGIFVCYEIKSCLADYRSGYGQNFVGEENYLVMPIELWKKVRTEMSWEIGVLVPVPVSTGRKLADVWKEIENPTEFKGDPNDWRLHELNTPTSRIRKKSMVELLFAMLMR